jgi:hypothetical protein
MRFSKLASAALLVLAIGVVSVPVTIGAPPPTQGVRLTAIGQPNWKPVDFHLFSAPIGTTSSGYVEFGDTLFALLPPPDHVFNPVLFVGPGAPHAPPYDAELGDGVAALGFHEGVRFAVSEFSDGAGIYLVFMAVPDPGTVGSSPDYTAGPIIPNSLFPISFSATNERNGKPFSVVAAGSVAPLDAAAGFPGIDGHSHFPMFFADNADFGPPDGKLRGSYRLQVTMLDQAGNGWYIEAHFAIAP